MLEALKNLIYRVSAYQFAHTDGTPNEIARRLYPGKGQGEALMCRCRTRRRLKWTQLKTLSTLALQGT
jgi:hypothetical protein